MQPGKLGKQLLAEIYSTKSKFSKKPSDTDYQSSSSSRAARLRSNLTVVVFWVWALTLSTSAMRSFSDSLLPICPEVAIWTITDSICFPFSGFATMIVFSLALACWSNTWFRRLLIACCCCCIISCFCCWPWMPCSSCILLLRMASSSSSLIMEGITCQELESKYCTTCLTLLPHRRKTLLKNKSRSLVHRSVSSRLRRLDTGRGLLILR